jgi:hypothetical protein
MRARCHAACFESCRVARHDSGALILELPAFDRWKAGLAGDLMGRLLLERGRAWAMPACHAAMPFDSRYSVLLRLALVTYPELDGSAQCMKGQSSCDA